MLTLLARKRHDSWTVLCRLRLIKSLVFKITELSIIPGKTDINDGNTTCRYSDTTSNDGYCVIVAQISPRKTIIIRRCHLFVLAFPFVAAVKTIYDTVTSICLLETPCNKRSAETIEFLNEFYY